MVWKTFTYDDEEEFLFDEITVDELDNNICELIRYLMWDRYGRKADEILEFEVLSESYCDYAEELTMEVWVSWIWDEDEEIFYI